MFTRILSGPNVKHARHQRIAVAMLFPAFGLAAVPSASSRTSGAQQQQRQIQRQKQQQQQRQQHLQQMQQQTTQLMLPRGHRLQLQRGALLATGGFSCRQLQHQHQQQHSGSNCYWSRWLSVHFVTLLAVCLFCCVDSSSVAAATVATSATTGRLLRTRSRGLRSSSPHIMLHGQQSTKPEDKGSQLRYAEKFVDVKTGTPVSLLQQNTLAMQAVEKLKNKLLPLLQHLPGRLERISEAQARERTSEAIADIYSLTKFLPKCRISSADLEPTIGYGSFGTVFPLTQKSQQVGSCAEIISAASLVSSSRGKGAAAKAGEEAAQERYGVKIYRKISIEGLFEAVRNGRKEFHVTSLQKILAAIKGVQTRSELVVAAIRDALGTEAQIDFLRHLQGQKMISSEIFTEYHRLFEVAINAHYFTAEVEYSGLILHAALATLKKIDRTLYNAIQGNPRGDLFTILAAAGELFGFVLPIGGVLVSFEDGQQLWGSIIKIYDGDIDTRLKRPDNGSRLDAWGKPAREEAPGEANAIKAAAERKSRLREIARDKYSLLSVSAKMISPFVYLHNVFSLGHFDIKPSNVVFKKNRSIEVAVIDFGFLAVLGQSGPLRGTVAFAAPEAECEKEPTSPTQSVAEPLAGTTVSKIPYLASYDVYALGLTLSSAWNMSLSHSRRFLWTERCIEPLLLQGASLDFVLLRQHTGPQVYTQEIRKSLNRCVEPGGKIEKLYLSNMPFLVKAKIRQMIETNPVIRISASNAFAFIAVARALEAVRERPVEEAQQLLHEAQGTVLLRLSLSKAGTGSIEVGTARGRQQATETLRTLLELATWSPIREAVVSCVVPIPVATVMRLTTLPKVEEVAEVQEKLSRLLQWPWLQQQEGQMKGKSYGDLIDAVFGVNMEGLNVIMQQQIIDRKMSAANLLISRSVHLYLERQLLIDPYIQIIEETPSEDTIAFILKSVGISDERDSDILAYFKDRVFSSYVAWASADRLIRLGVRRCVSRDPAGASIHAKYSAGDVVVAAEKQLLQHCAWQQVTQICNETHYGPPWGVSAAFFDFGAPEEQISVHLRDVVTPLHMEAAWRTEDALSLLHLQVDRAVSRLCIVAAGVAATTPASAAAAAAAALPENLNLRDIYTKIMMEMQRDNYVPFAFGNHQERPEYTEAMFNLSVLNFKRAVVFTAAKRQLGIVASETLKSMRKSRRSAATVDSVLSELPESILAWGRYATEEAIAKDVIREIVEKEIKIANTPKTSGLQSIWITINGPFIRLKETYKQTQRAMLKHVQMYPKTTAAHFNSHFTQLLRSSALAPGCKSYSAVLKRKEADGTYSSVDDKKQLLSGDGQKHEFKLFAVPPKAGSNLRSLNNCFFWTAQFLSLESYVVPPPTPAGSVVVDIDT